MKGDQALEWLSREDEVSGRQTGQALLGCKPCSTFRPPVLQRRPDCEILVRGGTLLLRLRPVLASVLTGLAFIERELSAQFFASGRNDLTKASIARLMDEALKYGWITAGQRSELTRARHVRNAVAHYQEAQTRLNLGHHQMIARRQTFANFISEPLTSESFLTKCGRKMLARCCNSCSRFFLYGSRATGVKQQIASARCVGLPCCWLLEAGC